MRRSLKALLVSACVVFAGACLLSGAAVAYLSTYENADWERLAVRLVRAATGHELKVDGEFSLVLSWHPSLTITRFSVLSGATASPFEVPSATKLEITLDLPRLRQKVIHVERLRLEGATIEWNAQEDGGARAGRVLPRLPWAILLSDASVTSSRGAYRRRAGAAPTTFDLDSLTLTAAGSTGLRELSGRGTIDGYLATVAGRIGTIEEFLAPTGPFPVDIEAKVRGGTVAVKGTVARPAAGAGLALDITAEAPEVADLIRLVRRDWPETGVLRVRGRLAGDLPGARLEDVAAEITGRGGSRLRCTGRVEDVGRWAGVALEFKADVPDASRFAQLSGKAVPAFGRVAMKGRLTGSRGELGLEDLSVSVKGDGFEAEAEGKAGRLRTGRGFPPADLDLSVSARGADLSAWSGLAGRDLPALGPISFRARVTDHDGALGLADADLTVGASSSAQVHVQGTVERLVWQPRLAASGVSFRIEGSADPMSRLFVGRPPAFPLLDHAVEGAAELSDADGSVGLENVRLEVWKDGSATVSAAGSVDDIENLRGAVVTVHGQAPTLEAFTPLLKHAGGLGRDLPPVGPVRATARLVDGNGTLGLDGVRVEIGSPDRFQLEATGRFADLRALDQIDCDLQLTAKDLSALAALLERPLPRGSPVQMSAHFAGSYGKGRLSGLEVNLGRTKIRGEASYDVHAGKPTIAARLRSPLMEAADVYLTRFSTAEVPETVSVAGAGGQGRPGQTPPPSKRLFSDEPLPLGWLQRMNLDVSLVVEELRAGPVRVDAVQSALKLQGAEGKLEIFESLADGGSLKAVVEVDGRGQVPEFALKVTATKWDSGALAAQLTNRRYVKGQADGTIDLKARGTSLRELMSSLDGKIVSVMAGGTLRGVAIDLLTAPVYRQLLGGKDPGEVALNCAVEDLEIESGLATERTLLADTQVSTVTGVGTIDLRTEQIDLVLRPEPKQPRLATIKTPVSIRGDLANPTVTVESKESFFKKLAAAVGLGVLNPFAAVIPFMSTGSLDHHPCSKFLKPDRGSTSAVLGTEGTGLEGAPNPAPEVPGPQTGRPDRP